MDVGIERINAYLGQACIDVRMIFEHRGLELKRFGNLLMDKKSVCLPCEDSVTNGVNAAKPLIDSLDRSSVEKIELLITSTESGLDFGKSLSNYLHDYLGLSRRCRMFEVKQACYGGTAALQMAANFVRSNAAPGAKALVVATDITSATAKHTYAEPSQGTGAVAMIVGDEPHVLELDFGANGYHGYEVMDTCRPDVHVEAGDPDLSLLSYLDCLEQSFRSYVERVEGADFQSAFDYLVFHTPFGGMVKGAHRNMLRNMKVPPESIERDFKQRVTPSLKYCAEVGNIYSASIFLALIGLIDSVPLDSAKRVGLFSYGSGCSSEFYSGIISRRGQELVRALGPAEALRKRYRLNMAEYENLLTLNSEWTFGVRDRRVDVSGYRDIYDRQFTNSGLLVLESVGSNYHRKYNWAH
ncbi:MULTISPECIES: hydroxymethylglutaryl-CoA synthase family protein [Sorangium]|uniref:Beta branching 3-hydroxyl-3-methylglutaryl-CoA synthase n=2 Tax=Sorangium TaxID=39643 RepID=A0A1S6R4X3_SORCE|nr:hydroxymethylglutaryl-CoA synthase family protein [Sorangium aterium]AQW44880.1 beta branching 3-hydroxyl-3-methylglutaryl-CoA synthase [Sorangium cellulosum]MDC0681356.1 hydroxymethylglutaryl-CoA synthase family protein [Sorangium aterium]